MNRKMDRTRERQEFVAMLSRKTTVPFLVVVDLAREAMCRATAEQKWCELDCSVNIDDEERARQERKSEQRLARMQALANELGLPLEAQADPRGAVYRLGGVSVPADGYTGEQIEALATYWERRRDVEKVKP